MLINIETNSLVLDQSHCIFIEDSLTQIFPSKENKISSLIQLKIIKQHTILLWLIQQKNFFNDIISSEAAFKDQNIHTSETTWNTQNISRKPPPSHNTSYYFISQQPNISGQQKKIIWNYVIIKTRIHISVSNNIKLFKMLLITPNKQARFYGFKNSKQHKEIMRISW